MLCLFQVYGKVIQLCIDTDLMFCRYYYMQLFVISNTYRQIWNLAFIPHIKIKY